MPTQEENGNRPVLFERPTESRPRLHGFGQAQASPEDAKGPRPEHRMERWRRQGFGRAGSERAEAQVRLREGPATEGPGLVPGTEAAKGGRIAGSPAVPGPAAQGSRFASKPRPRRNGGSRVRPRFDVPVAGPNEACFGKERRERAEERKVRLLPPRSGGRRIGGLLPVRGPRRRAREQSQARQAAEDRCARAKVSKPTEGKEGSFGSRPTPGTVERRLRLRTAALEEPGSASFRSTSEREKGIQASALPRPAGNRPGLHGLDGTHGDQEMASAVLKDPAHPAGDGRAGAWRS